MDVGILALKHRRVIPGGWAGQFFAAKFWKAKEEKEDQQQITLCQEIIRFPAVICLLVFVPYNRVLDFSGTYVGLKEFLCLLLEG